MRIFVVFSQIVFTLLLTLVVSRWAFTFGLVDSFLKSDRVADIYVRILTALNNVGGEDAEALLMIVVLTLMLIPSIFICRLVSRQLRRWLSNKTRQ